jgi:uncharacterized RDD family membrane protein YckC
MPTQYPSLTQRMQSLVIDQALILAMMLVSAGVLDRFEKPPDWVRIALFFSIWGVYEPVCMAFACTLGNFILGIRARRVNDPTKRMNLVQAYIRYITKLVLGWLSFVTLNMNKERRAIHDLIASTVMIKI